MKHTTARNAAFSLIEVSITLGVVVFALVGLVGVLPVAIEQSRLCVNETHGAQLARMICTTIEGEPYKASKCFSTDGSTVDYSSMTSGSSPLVLFASYDVRNDAHITRSKDAPANAEYRIELRFTPMTLDGTSSTDVRGQSVNIRITDYPAQKSVAFEGVQFIPRLLRSVPTK
jgi:uncharacterized protein (TIGR02598 family)